MAQQGHFGKADVVRFIVDKLGDLRRKLGRFQSVRQECSRVTATMAPRAGPHP